MNQKIFNEYVSSRGNKFEYQNVYYNRSYEGEKPGNDNLEEIIADMKKFLKRK